MRTIKLNYDVVLTIFVEPSLWRAKIFEKKNQDDPQNHKSTCNALKPIFVIRKKNNFIFFSFEINIILVTGSNKSLFSWIFLTYSKQFCFWVKYKWLGIRKGNALGWFLFLWSKRRRNLILLLSFYFYFYWMTKKLFEITNQNDSFKNFSKTKKQTKRNTQMSRQNTILKNPTK